MNNHQRILKRINLARILPLFLIIVWGLGLRFLDLNDPPLDFTAWRQLRSATITRGMYYDMLPDNGTPQQSLAISLGKSFEKLEPEIFERIVALSYLLIGKEILPIARVWAIIFWLIGGLFLYDLAKRITSSAAALVSLSIFMVLPFAVTVSRSFLPDVFMTMWIIIASYCLFRWTEHHTWKWAFISGVTAGLAILSKVFAVFPISFALIFVVFSTWKPQFVIRDRQVWLVGAITLLVPASYYLIQTLDQAGDYLAGWVFAFSDLQITRGFYTQWMDVLDRLVGFLLICLGLIGTWISPRRSRMLLIGLWIGYLMVGLSVPSLIFSHTYYNTQLIPILSLSLAPFAELVIERAKQQSNISKAALICISLIALGYLSLQSYRELKSRDYREEIKGWIQMGNQIPADSRLIGLTHDYNNRLAYYGWRDVAQWPHLSDYEMLSLAGGNYDPKDKSVLEEFKRRTQGYDYFIVTLFMELDSQAMLKTLLQENYPSISGEGFILYDLREMK